MPLVELVATYLGLLLGGFALGYISHFLDVRHAKRKKEAEFLAALEAEIKRAEQEGEVKGKAVEKWTRRIRKHLELKKE